MDWLSEVNKRYRRNNQILFSKESEYLQDLRMLFEEQDHKTMVLWAMDFAAELLLFWKPGIHWRNDPRGPLKRPGNGHLGRLRCDMHSERYWIVTHLRRRRAARRMWRSAMPLDRPVRWCIPLVMQLDTQPMTLLLSFIDTGLMHVGKRLKAARAST